MTLSETEKWGSIALLVITEVLVFGLWFSASAREWAVGQNGIPGHTLEMHAVRLETQKRNALPFSQ